jgi:hypothetical protein
VRELVEAMGGAAEVRSERGAGATFAIELPVPAGDRSQPESPPAFVRVARSPASDG